MRVCIIPEYPMSLMTGGMQVIARETCLALKAIGQESELFSWSQERPPADFYHFMGFPQHLARIAHLVRQAGRPYVITMLFRGGAPSRSNLYAAKIRQYIKSRILGQRELYQAVHGAVAITTYTQGDALAAHSIFGVNKNLIHIIEGGIDNAFFSPSPAAWHEQFGPRPFVLCVGAIQLRKNQLLLLEACNLAQLPVVLLGPVLPGERSYSEKVAASMKANERYGGRWLTTLQNEDPLLPSAYAACRLYALLSADETQPLSVMQAMAARKPVQLLRASYADDSLFSHLPAVASSAVPEVAEALKAAWQQQAPTSLSPTYSWESVARKFQKLYVAS